MHRPRLRRIIAERFEDQPSWVILIELFIGLGWLRAAVTKIIEPEWWNGSVIDAFVVEHQDLALPWIGPFLDRVVVPASIAVAAVVLVGQLVAGLTLIARRHVVLGLFAGMTMNLVFIMAGAIDPSIFYLILQAALALWLFENSAAVAVSDRSLRFIVWAAVALVLVSAPFVGTLDPTMVVEDPATILVTYGVAIGVSAFVARGRLADSGAVTRAAG